MAVTTEAGGQADRQHDVVEPVIIIMMLAGSRSRA